LLRANLGIWSFTFQAAHLDLVAAFDVSLSADKPTGSIDWWNFTINNGGMSPSTGGVSPSTGGISLYLDANEL
jgi:hypothetical protein